MRIALMQKAFICADITSNLNTILEAVVEAKAKGASLLVTPYWAVTGMPLMQLLQHDFLFEAIEEALQKLLLVEGIGIVLSYPKREKSGIKSCQSIIHEGKLIYQVTRPLSEEAVSTALPTFRWEGLTIGIKQDNFSRAMESVQSVDIMLLQFTEPFYAEIGQARLERAYSESSQLPIPILATVPLGANDQYLYDGGSFALDDRGLCQFQATMFGNGVHCLDYIPGKGWGAFLGIESPKRIALLYQAVVFSLKEYMRKNQFTRVCLGLSGGIDSALVLALACEAVGAESCEVFLMPSQYTSSISNELALKLVRTLKVNYHVVPIQAIVAEFSHALQERFSGLPEDVTEENLQARTRGVLLMALSNKTGALLLCTGNKSEEAVGYSTLYGDTNGGFAPIKDLYKTEVYEMAYWLNEVKGREIIPGEIIKRKPTAELKFNQTDQDALPEYDFLDKVLKLILENKSLQDLVQAGYDQTIVIDIMKRVRSSEFKRQQGVLGPQLSKRSFGREWQYPITHLDVNF
ncbi:MAG: NAD(+) synthase [Neisseriaceae bacterium]